MKYFREFSIKFLLTDLDGVLRHYPSHLNQKIEERLQLPSGSILSAAFVREALQDVVTGAITDEAWRQMAVKNLAKITSLTSGEAAIRV